MTQPETVRYPDTQQLAREAFEATGVKTHAEFAALLHDAIPLRTFRRWLAGKGPAGTLERLVLREVRDGWRPSAS